MAGCLAWLFAPDNGTPNKAVGFRKSEKPPLEIQARPKWIKGLQIHALAVNCPIVF
jgi:hypothetical protein